jgi:hypothetical protein
VDALELACLQFGVTTLFHFIFVPTSSGLAGLPGERAGDEPAGGPAAGSRPTTPV